MRREAGRPPTAATARQSTLREANLGIVLREVCAADEPVSRAGVAAASGLTRSTVSRLVDDLVAGGLVDEGELRMVGPGRPATLLYPAAGVVALGLQVNAAHVAARLINLRGEIVAESRSEPDLVGSDPAGALRLLQAHLATALEGRPRTSRVLGARLAVPGLVDSAGLRLLRAPNLGWSDVDPGALLAPFLDGVPFSLDNEATLAAHAFAQPRPGRRGPHSSFIYISGEIGIGGAVVVDGEVQRGSRGFAGEIGHMTFLPGGEPCPCGSSGCLERYAGRLAIAQRAGMSSAATLADLARFAREGHPASREAVALAAEALGVVLAGVVNLVDVSTVVLGGELASLADLVSPAVESTLRSRVMASDWMDLVLTEDQDDVAGSSGAALRSLARVVEHPVHHLTA